MRKTKIYAKFMVVMLVAIMALIMFVGTTEVSAVSITGTNKLGIKRTVKDITRNVNATFNYKVEQVAGPEEIDVTGITPTVAFNPAVTPTGAVAAKTNDIALDFSSLNFSKLGDYVFKVTELSDNDDEIPSDTTNEYYVVVQVRNTTPNDPDGELTATLVAKAYTTWNDTNGVGGEKKDMAFESTVPKNNVTITKEVQGNMADINEYFKFTITMINGLPNAQYTLSGDYLYGENKETPATNQTFTGTSVVVWMKDNGSVTIGDVLEGTKYKVEEADSSYDTYIGSVDNANKKKSTSNDGIEVVSNSDDDTKFINYKEKATITGVFLDVAPFAALIGLAIFGIVLIRRTSNND